MNSNKQPQKIRDEETFDCVRKCLEKTRAWEKIRTIKEINHQKRHFQSELKSFLYRMPLLSTLTFGAVYIAFVSTVAFFVVQISIISGSRSGNNIRIFGIFFILFFSVFFIVKFISMTPKSQVGYNERWQKTLELYLERSGIEKLYKTRTKHYQEARRRLKISIDHYLRESKILGFFVNVVWGGVFIGCLPDKEFQIALITYSPKCISNANPFGFLSLIISPIIFFEYFRRYYLPSAWMEQIINQIDLLNE